MMRSFLYLLFSLTTTTIVAALSLAESLGEAGSSANEFQSTIYAPSTDNSEGNLFDDSAGLVGLDNDIPSSGLGNEEAEANNENGGACSGSKSTNRKRRRGKGENNYCSPTDAPASAQFGPHSQQEEGSEGAGAGGSSTTGTRTNQEGGSDSSSKSGLQLGTEGDNMVQYAPWSSTQTSCPGKRPVPVCAGAQLQPYGLSPGWQSIPFSDLPPPPEEIFYWPYCRLWTFNAPCKTELKLELFMCCEYIKKNVPGGRDTGFEMRVRRYMTLEYPFNGHSCVAAVEPRTRL